MQMFLFQRNLNGKLTRKEIEVYKLKNLIIEGKIDRKNQTLELQSEDISTFFDLITGDILHVFYEEGTSSKVYPLPELKNIVSTGQSLPIKYQKLLDKLREKEEMITVNVKRGVDQLIEISSKNREKMEIILKTSFSGKANQDLLDKFIDMRNNKDGGDKANAS